MTAALLARWYELTPTQQGGAIVLAVWAVVALAFWCSLEVRTRGLKGALREMLARESEPPTAAERLNDRLEVLSRHPLPPFDWFEQPRRTAITESARRARLDSLVESNLVPFQPHGRDVGRVLPSRKA